MGVESLALPGGGTATVELPRDLGYARRLIDLASLLESEDSDSRRAEFLRPRNRLKRAWQVCHGMIDAMLEDQNSAPTSLIHRELELRNGTYTALRRPGVSEVLEFRPSEASFGDQSSVGRYEHGLGRVAISHWQLWGGHLTASMRDPSPPVGLVPAVEGFTVQAARRLGETSDLWYPVDHT
jgi:hypothetical protein